MNNEVHKACSPRSGNFLDSGKDASYCDKYLHVDEDLVYKARMMYIFRLILFRLALI